MISVDITELEQFVRGNTLGVLVGLYLLTVVSSLVAFTFFKKDSVAVPVDASQEPTAQEGTHEITVELSGAVNKPGVYHLTSKARVIDLLNEGAGLSDDAFTEWISKNMNFSRVLSDSEKVYVPFVWDIEPEKSVQVGVLAKKVVDASLPDSPRTQAASDEDGSEGKINLNLASIEDIDTLPGVGEVYATRIVAARPYSGVDELAEKAELPSSLVAKIEGLVTF